MIFSSPVLAKKNIKDFKNIFYGLVRTPAKKTPVKRLLQTEFTKTPTSSPLTRAKLTNHINEKVSSPFALNNLEQDSNVMVVKRRRNVPTSTISTQTDTSYLSKPK